MRASELVDRHAKKWRFQALHRLEVIRQAWKKAAGPYVSKHVVPVRLVRKTLRVASEDSIWVQEMAYLKDEILARLLELLPKSWVDEIQLVLGPLPKEGKEAIPDLLLPKATKAMQEQAETITKILKDPKLADSIQKAMLAGLRRQQTQKKP